MPLIDDLIEKGELVEAMRLADATLGQAPTAENWLLAFKLRTMLCDFVAAEQALAWVLHLQPALAGGVARFRAGMETDRQLFQRLRDPELAQKRAGAATPPPEALAHVKAAYHHAIGDHGAARAALGEAKTFHRPNPGRVTFWEGQSEPFADLTDMDDLTGACLFGATPEGPLDFWLAFVRRVEFRPPRSHIETLWAPATVTLRDGRALDARIPTRYPGYGIHPSALVRSGRTTSFERERGYAVAHGQRDYTAGNRVFGIEGIAVLAFDE